MANDADVGFFYELGIETNIDEVTKQLKGLNSIANKTVAGITGGLTGLKLFSNQFRDLDVLSRKLQETPEYIRQIQFEFDALGFSMQDGLGLVDKLATNLKDLEFKGQFNEAFARVGIRIEETDTVENLASKLRTAFVKDPRLFTAFSGDLGLSQAELGYLTQGGADFRKNRAFATEQVSREDLPALIQNEKDLNQNLSELTASVTRLGNEILGNVDKLIPVINFLSDNLKAVAIGLVALKVGGGVAGAIKGGGAKGLAVGLLGKLAIPAVLGYGAYLGGKKFIESMNESNLTTTGEKGRRKYEDIRKQHALKKENLLSQVIIGEETDSVFANERRRQDLLDVGKTVANTNSFTFNMMSQEGVNRTLEVINATMEE